MLAGGGSKTHCAGPLWQNGTKLFLGRKTQPAASQKMSEMASKAVGPSLQPVAPLPPLPHTQKDAKSKQVPPSSSQKLACMHAKLVQSSPILCNPMVHRLPGFSVHGISQGKILEWVAMPSSRGSSQPRNRTASLAYPALVGGSVPLVPPLQLNLIKFGGDEKGDPVDMFYLCFLF